MYAIRSYYADHPNLKIVITADDLYSKKPFVELLKKLKMSFILVAKPTDHTILFEQVLQKDEQDEADVIEWKDKKGLTHRYEWINGLRLNGGTSVITSYSIHYTKLYESLNNEENFFWQWLLQ